MKPSAMTRVAAFAVAVLALAVAATATQRPAAPVTDGEHAVRVEKSALLVAALKRESPVTPQQLAEAVRVALADADPTIRQLALATVSGPSVVSSFTTSGPDLKREWIRERPELQRLRPAIVRALEDSDAAVRQAAVGALQSLDYDGIQAYGRALSADTTAILGRRYPTESSPTVRAFIVAVLGATVKQNPPALRTVRAATRDEAASVRDMARRALSELER